MTDHIILDLEIQKPIDELPGGWSDTHLMGVSVAVCYEVMEDRYLIYGPDHIAALKQRLERADRITGFNLIAFDEPVIYGLLRPQKVHHLVGRSDDLLRRIWQAVGLNPDIFTKAHGGWGLDAICRATFGSGKTGNGAMAPILYQQGRWVELINYCLEDVRITRNLCRWIDEGKPIRGQHGPWLTVPPWEGGC